MAIDFSAKDLPHTNLAVWKIEETEHDLLNLLPPLKSKEAEFLQNISHTARRMEWLASRVLIHRLTGLYPAIHYNRNGQPTLPGSKKNISISHTHHYAAILLSEESMPGVDIEFPSSRIRKVSDRFLNPKEKTFINDTTSDLQMGIIWCAKEAIYKTAGIPGLIFKDQIIISAFHPVDDHGILKASLITQEREQQLLLNYRIDQNYFLVWTK